MPGTWDYPYWSPNHLSVVTLVINRPDFPIPIDLYGGTVGGTYFEGMGDLAGQQVAFVGWMDDYTAVYDITDWETNATRRFEMDTTTGGIQYLDLSVSPNFSAQGGRLRTSADRNYTTKVSRSQSITIRRKGKKKAVATFHLPGAGRSWSEKKWHFASASISPDARFIAYRLVLMSPADHSQPKSRIYVCTIKGKSARRIRDDFGGFQWK